MNFKITDISGKKYGKLTVINLYENKNGRTYWKCKCDCGNECIRRKDYLNDNSSCGCTKIKHLENQRFGTLLVESLDHTEKGRVYWKCKCDCGNECIKLACNLSEKSVCGNKCKLKKVYKTHGDSNTRFYKLFMDIKKRCNNKNHSHYKDYGGRGIKVLWNSYEEFKNDMYDSYLSHCEKYGEDNTSIDRIDVNGNYCKENCRWVTIEEQSYNKRNTVYVEMEDGKLISISELAKKINKPKNTLMSRYLRSEYKGTHRIPYSKLIKDEDIV